VSTITLSKTERDEFLREARRELVAELISQHKEDFDLISRAQAGGILDVAPNTLASVPGLKPVNLVPGSVVKYRLSNIRALVTGKGGAK
jgi:hypothetical protein